MIKKTYYEKAREAGVCVRCGSPSTTPRCSDCNKKTNEQVKQMRKTRKENGKCIQCDSYAAGNSLCEPCSALRQLRQEGLDAFSAGELLEWLGRRIYETIGDVEANQVVASERRDYARLYASSEQLKCLKRLAKDYELTRSAATKL
jgi:hypothetical protein